MKKKILIILGLFFVVIVPFAYSSMSIFYKLRTINILDMIILIGILLLCYGIYYRRKKN